MRHRRPRARAAAPAPGSVTGLLAAGLVLLAGCGPAASPAPSYVVAPAGHRAPLTAGAFLPLRTAGPRILDAAGRQVILRGLEIHDLQDVAYGGRRVLPGDDARIASWGFTTVRFAISLVEGGAAAGPLRRRLPG